MAHAGNRHVGFGCHFVNERRALGGKTLAPDFDGGDAVVLLQRRRQRLEHDVGEFLAVVQQRNAKILQRLRTLSGWNCAGLRSAGRYKNGRGAGHGDLPSLLSSRGYTLVYPASQAAPDRSYLPL